MPVSADQQLGPPPPGCSKQYSQEGSQAHVCPRCNNGSVYATKERNCLEICCVPLVPLGSSHLYMCSICQWQASQSGPAPPLAQQGGGYYGQPQGYGGGGVGQYPQQQQMGYREFPAFPSIARQGLTDLDRAAQQPMAPGYR
ncbi:hypothetical protein JCM21900_001263 [Sporobolomyces salmonicolor]